MFNNDGIALKAIILNILYIPLVSLLAWLHIPQEPMLILAVLLGIDFFTGITKVFILKGHLRSYRAIAGMLTKGSILLLVMTLALMAKGLNLDFKFYISLFISVLIISETYSVFGNVYAIKTGEEIEEFDAVAMAIKRVRVVIERLLISTRGEL